MTSQLPQRPGEADCRDYLRTGRCKYGDSCKYHHPSNVMSGGGVKGPIDPNEPLFPIRPDEQACQYYMKHGTCKFGQTCKFHHPVHFLKQQQQQQQQQQQLSSSSSNTSPSTNTEATVNSIIMNNNHATVSASDCYLLPQRPGEQDCIYFLRNGRCKYGVSCKYHHPRVRGRSVSAGSIPEATGMLNFQLMPSQGSKVFSLTGAPSQQQQQQQQQQHQSQQATHILLSDGPISLMAVNQNYPHQRNDHNNNNNNNNNNIPFYCQEIDPMLPPDHSSYPSSAYNNHRPPHPKEDWPPRNRPPSYEDDNVSEMHNHFYPQRRFTPPDRPAYMNNDEIRMHSHNRPPMGAEIHKRWGSHMSLPSSNNMEANNNNNAQEYSSLSPQIPLSSSAPSHLGRNYLMEHGNRRPHQSSHSFAAHAHQEKDQGRKMDDGLSMMTSALLTMLDTPDDKGKIIQEEYGLPSTLRDMEQHRSISGGIQTSRSSHSLSIDRSSHSLSIDTSSHSLSIDRRSNHSQSIDRSNHSLSIDRRSNHNVYSDHNGINNSSNNRMYNNPHIHHHPNNHHLHRSRSASLPIHRNDSTNLTSRETGRWSPSWRGGYSANSGHELERNAQSVAALQNSQAHATPKIGLYLS